MPTPAVDVLLVAAQALESEERRTLLERLREERLREIAADDSETGFYLRSLIRVTEVVGHEPSVDEYRDTQKKLVAQGEEIVGLTKLQSFFGSWRAAKEALMLSKDETALRIQARFRAQRTGKVHKYTDEQLRVTLLRCAAAIGHVPLVADLQAWRLREEELARAAGEAIYLPSDSPYRRRWGSWEGALRAVGFTQQEIDERLTAGRLIGAANIEGDRMSKCEPGAGAPDS